MKVIGKQVTSPRFYTIAFVVSVLLLLFIAGVTYKQLLSLNHSQGLVIHSHEVHIELERLFSEIKDAESEKRGYLITRHPDYLAAYDSSRQDIRHSLTRLDSLVADNPKQRFNLVILKTLANQRLMVLARALNESHNSEPSMETMQKFIDEGKSLTAGIKSQITRMLHYENSLLKNREIQYEYNTQLAPFTALFIVLFSLFVFIVSFYKLSENVREQEELNARLTIVNKAFEHAEAMANVGHWQWNQRTGEVLFSDNLYRLLGAEAGAFQPSLDTLLSYVHPEDREELSASYDKSLTGHEQPANLFRVNRPDGALRYFSSLARRTGDSYSHSTLICITRDITDEHLNLIALEDNNRELESSNAELASFNHIASHDLQEPLRKIQMFISRIREPDSPETAASNAGFLAKIQYSANRMQKLIQDLLLYASTTRSEQFADTDLGELLDSVLQEMATNLEEKQAEVEVTSVLPVMNVIPFQIRQLLINLLGNSLKYSKEDIPPIIRISGKTISVENEGDILYNDKRYYRISVEDNGIGFEQQYAEKLFAPFYRLHDRKTYSGTGIGLAICKKVMDNHDGFITAEGRPGAGATIHVFLPLA